MKKDCLERPRKKGAKYTNKDIRADDVIQDLAVGYDAKRDRYNGFDPADHTKVYEHYSAMESARQKVREEEIDKQTTTDLAVVRKVAKAGKAEGKQGDLDFGSSDEEDADEDKYADAADAVGQKLDTKTRITVRNLRIREDTAKYLLNLDPESAYYDPKTRSMRDAPNEDVPPEEVNPFCRVSYTIANSVFRQNLQVKTSFAIRVKPKMFRIYNYSRGTRPHVETTYIYMQILLLANFFTENLKRRRPS